METPPVPQVLLHHGQFVRALAGALLRDGDAEEVAQETWLRYLASPPAEKGRLRQWLSVVVRNLAIQRARSEHGRAARERRAARPEALPSAHEELEHDEILDVVVQAVLALDEPYRSTIVDRYYRGLDARAIAEKHGTTPATVRSREHRALEKLRERLDRHCEGGRGAWAAVLAGFAPAATIAWPLVAMLPALLVVAAGVFLWSRTPTTQEPGLVAVSGAAGPVPDPVAGVASGPVVLAPAEAPASTRVVLGGSAPERASLVDSDACELRGRLVFHGGEPGAGVPLEVHGWGEEPSLPDRASEAWTDPQDEADADGRFSLRFEPPRAFQFMLFARAPGRAEARWRWSELAPGATVDLGEVELPVGGTIEGRIVDTQGTPLLGEEWTVHARTVGLGQNEGRDDTEVFARVASSTGAFRLVDVWPTQVKLTARSAMASWIDGPSVVVRSGETTMADIVYSGPRNARRITVDTRCEPFHVMNSPDPLHMRLTGPDGATRTARRIPSSSQSFSFEDLPPGSYVLDIDDPRYVPWSRFGLTPGQSVHADLKGNAALRLSVFDVAGEPVERCSVVVAFRNVAFSPREFEVHDGASALPDGLVRGLFPGDYTVAVRCPDGATARCDVDGLTPNETRDVRLELANQLFAAGHVLHAPDEGVDGAEVLLLVPAALDDSDASPIAQQGMGGDSAAWRIQLASKTTDPDGAFRFDLTSPGPFLVGARAAGSQVFSQPLVLASSRADLELVLPRPATVHGHVLAPAGTSFDGLGLWIAPTRLWEPLPPGPAGLARVTAVADSIHQAMAPLAADGAFTLEDLPPGQSRVFLVVRELVDEFGLTDRGVTGAQELGELEVPAGRVLERDFAALQVPGTLTLVLRLNGGPGAFVDLTLRANDEGRRRIRGRTDAQGRTARLRVPPGTWSVYAQDQEAGWAGWIAPTLAVESGGNATATLALETGRGALVCVDAAGQPLAGADVYVMHAGGRTEGAGWYPLARRRTDAGGSIELELLPGEYTLHRQSDVDSLPGTEPGTAFTWTSSGPLVERVQL